MTTIVHNGTITHAGITNSNPNHVANSDILRLVQDATPNQRRAATIYNVTRGSISNRQTLARFAYLSTPPLSTSPQTPLLVLPFSCCLTFPRSLRQIH
ncbi:hypothetical protein EJ02DRAFT_15772 [Clathrospora elynae]|uniref:Uncharacterized protein n=1 Tax=Clathrospora elynae TaxID=706981 RepID=A0A6A5SGN9_9PLEO|nr:hypothetical protein EJ02DRAFT_15772 [Clathrospora elynae]